MVCRRGALGAVRVERETFNNTHTVTMFTLFATALFDHKWRTTSTIKGNFHSVDEEGFWNSNLGGGCD